MLVAEHAEVAHPGADEKSTAMTRRRVSLVWVAVEVEGGQWGCLPGAKAESHWSQRPWWSCHCGRVGLAAAALLSASPLPSPHTSTRCAISAFAGGAHSCGATAGPTSSPILLETGFLTSAAVRCR